jgi:hypothetical protein
MSACWLRRKRGRSAGAVGALQFMNAMSPLDSGDADDRIGERLETDYRGAAPLERAMILLDYIVGMLAASYLCFEPLRIFPPE